MLMFAYGASSVKCASCNFITSAVGQPGAVPPAGTRGGEAGTSSGGASAGGLAGGSDGTKATAFTTVVVENPHTLDADGNETTSTVLGVALVPERVQPSNGGAAGSGAGGSSAAGGGGSSSTQSGE